MPWVSSTARVPSRSPYEPSITVAPVRSAPWPAVVKLSSTTTSCPAASSASTDTDPT